MKIHHAIVIGVGGTGSHLIEPMARLLKYHRNGTDNLIIVDGDKFEETNSTRQLFNPRFLNMNKAQAKAKELNYLNLNPIDQFLTESKFKALLQKLEVKQDETLLIVMSVDNHATRHAILNVLNRLNFQNVIVLSPGNDLSHGQVVSWVKVNGEELTLHPFKKYDELLHPSDHIPGSNNNCQAEAVSSPQLITANASAALICLWFISSVLDDKPIYDEIHFDCRKMMIVPQGDPITI